jgi:DMSO reductase anchor subunit
MRQHFVSTIAIASLAGAAVAYVPSAAAFTPAILLSFIAAVGAVIAALFGSVRLAVITLLVVAATVLVSPLSGRWLAISRIDLVMVACAVAIAGVSAALFWDYRRRSASA